MYVYAAAAAAESAVEAFVAVACKVNIRAFCVHFGGNVLVFIVARRR